MALKDQTYSGKVRTDAGAGVENADVSLLVSAANLAGTATGSEVSTNSDGTWSFTVEGSSYSLAQTYDVKIEAGASIRYLPYSDEIVLKGVDTSYLKIRGAADGDAAPLYFIADQGDDAGDIWRINVLDSSTGTLAIGSDKASAGTIIDYLTITNGASAAASVAAFGGDLTVGDDLSLTSDSAVFNMGAGNDFTITHDGTTGATIAGNPVTITASGASTWSTSSGALTITSAAALNLNPAGGSAILLDGTISVDAGVVTGATAITSQTIDATTDFTIGTTVITDDSIVMTPTTDDTVTIAAATNGVLNITTVDTAAAAANLNVVVDGAVDVDAAGAINLDAGSGIWTFEDSGTEVLRITESGSGDVTIKLETNAKDLIFTDNGDATNMTIKDAAAGIVVPGEVMTTKVSYTDGDDAITIADGGGITAAAGITSTAAANAFGASSFAGNVSLADAANVSISTPLLANADHTTTGITAEMLAGAAIAAFNLVCIHTTTQEVNVADASAVATARAIGIAPAAISDTATGTVLLKGFIRDDTWNWTTGSVLYLSETAGEMTHTAPTTDGAFVQTVGIALEPDVVYINPSLDIIEHA